MESTEKSHQITFSDIVKKAYEKGNSENELTVKSLVEVLMAELKNMKVS